MSNKTFVRMCAAFHGKVEMDIVSGSQIFSLTYRDPERVRGGLPAEKEEDNYQVDEEVFDFAIKEITKMTPIEREMVRKYLFEQCGEEIVRIRKQQQDNFFKCVLLSTNPEEYEKLSEKERNELEGIYEVDIDWDAL
jgi:hypothetical protein